MLKSEAVYGPSKGDSGAPQIVFAPPALGGLPVMSVRNYLRRINKSCKPEGILGPRGKLASFIRLARRPDS